MLRICSWFILLCTLSLPAEAQISGAVRVIDGDTLEVGGQRIRLHGIDAPEDDQPCTSALGAALNCGDWVTDQVRARYQGAQAHCTPVDQDRYGRVVAKCRVNGQDIGRILVEDGLAYAFRRYSLDYDLEEKSAFVAQRGLHGFDLEPPAEHRRNPPRARLAAGTACVIKGNISGSGRIYHMPGQEHYDKTVISPGRGERLFCTEAEAQAAGWRRARH